MNNSRTILECVTSICKSVACSRFIDLSLYIIYFIMSLDLMFSYMYEACSETIETITILSN